MDKVKSFIFLLSIIVICISCGKDDVQPEMAINIQSTNISLFRGDTLSYTIDASDNQELSQVISYLTIDDVIYDDVQELSGTEQTFENYFVINDDYDGMIKLSITLSDACDNQTTQEFEFEYKSIASSALDIKIKLEYRGQPLVMFTDYEYPDGRTINFTRFSMFMSDMMLDDQLLSEVSFHNLTSNNVTMIGAKQGLSYTIANVLPGSYSMLKFGLGIPSDENARNPSDFPTGHPLARAAEHWFSWASYIFTKIEGNLDSNYDGNKDLPLSLHIGADDAYRLINLQKPVTLIAGELSTVDLVIDVYDIFNSEDGIFDVDSDPQIHSLGQTAAIEVLANNMQNAIK